MLRDEIPASAYFFSFLETDFADFFIEDQEKMYDAREGLNLGRYGET